MTHFFSPSTLLNNNQFHCRNLLQKR